MSYYPDDPPPLGFWFLLSALTLAVFIAGVWFIQLIHSHPTTPP
jgi:hypothetical protein